MRWSALKVLLADKGGNVLVMTAASIVPIIALVGGGIDVGRIYLAESRLQSACDAGALAARRAMGGLTWTSASNEAAQSYFSTNFPEGKYATTDVSASFEADELGAVTGTASATVSMALMQFFGATTTSLSVTCVADLNLPNTDVMMVLDTTLSMNDPNPSDSVRRMDALRSAVISFFDAIEAAKPTGARIRYGSCPTRKRSTWAGFSSVTGSRIPGLMTPGRPTVSTPGQAAPPQQ